MLNILAIALSLSTSVGQAAEANPSDVCLLNAKVRQTVSSLRLSCNRMKDVIVATEYAYKGQPDSAKVCDRSPAIKAAILKNLGFSDCRDVTPGHLLLLTEFFVSGSSEKNPVRAMRHLKAGDLAGMYNTRTLVFEFTFLETIEAGAFRDMTNVSLFELSHSRMSDFKADTFCVPGQLGLARVKKMDMDSNRPAKGGTLPLGLFSCFRDLEDLDIDTSFVTHLPRGIFANNKKLAALDIVNCRFPESELAALRRVNGGLSLETGTDPGDHMTDWQIPERI